MKIGIACGGTGGHIFPGITMADVLRSKGHDVTLWLAGRDVEEVSTGGWKGRVERVKASGFSSGFSLSSAWIALGLIRACFVCWQRMKREKPDVVLAMGGYASVGPVLAAYRLKVPVVVHESNAVMGKAVSFLSRYASVVAFGFDSVMDSSCCAAAVVTGFPVRTDLNSHFEDGLLDPGVFTVLVMGGSQGARKLDKVVSGALCLARKKGVEVQVVHLARPENEKEVKDRYREAGVRHLVFGFLKEIGSAYNAADLAIARAGAATCAELSVCGVPALLIPLPSARRDHQTANARALEKNGGVNVLEEKNLSEEWLADYIQECARNPEKLAIMKRALAANAVPDAAAKIADLVLNVALRGKR